MTSKPEAKKEKKKKAKLKIWMKVILLFLLILTLLMVYPLVLSNLLQKEADANHTLPLAPYQNTLKFCSLNKDVYETKYKNGMILLIEPRGAYEKGEKVLVINRYANKQEHTIQNKYNVGVITEKTENEYTVSLVSYGKETIQISIDEIEGKITSRVLILGHFYNNMQGLRGYILFCVIPLLVVALVYFIMHLSIAETQVSVIKEETEPMKDALDITIETIRSTPKTDIRDFVEQENVKLYQIKAVNNPRKTNVKSISQPIDMTRQTQKKESQKSLTQAQRRKLEIMNPTHPDEILKKIAEKNKELLKEAEKELEFSKPEEDSAPNPLSDPLTKEQISVDTEANSSWLDADLTKPQMSADEILELYHQTQKEQESAQEHDNLNHIAKLYYDNDIESFKK